MSRDDLRDRAYHIFLAALDVDDSGARERFIEEACDGDPALRDEVDRVVERASQAGEWLESGNTLGDMADRPTQDLAAQAQGGTGTEPRDPEEQERQSELPAAVGKYRILSRLGDRSGQACVYRAWHPLLEKEVVIKLGISKIRAGSPERDYLVREAKTLAGLDHPSVARLLDLDFHDDRPYLVLELVRGRTLAQVAADSSFPVPHAAEILAKVAKGVEFLHSAGVVHRDIKPRNIILDDASEPRLIDLGLALVRDSLREDHIDEGEISGTIGFMSPEQARGEKESNAPASDIFSLGAVLYFLLVGRAPFENPGESWKESLQRARACNFDATLLERPGIPSRIARACLKAMSAAPGDRHGSAAEFRGELEGRRKTSPRALVALVVVVVSLVVAVVFMLRPPPEYGLVRYEFGRGRILLDRTESPPLRTEDSLMLVWTIPAELEASLFWFDSEGQLHSQPLAVVEKSRLAKTLRYPQASGKFEKVAGAPGTEVIFLCARRESPLTSEEVRPLLGDGTPWPRLPDRLLLHFDRERVWTERPGAPNGRVPPGLTRAPGGDTEAPDAAISRAEALRKRLLESCEFVSAIAFPHVASDNRSD